MKQFIHIFSKNCGKIAKIICTQNLSVYNKIKLIIFNINCAIKIQKNFYSPCKLHNKLNIAIQINISLFAND